MVIDKQSIKNAKYYYNVFLFVCIKIIIISFVFVIHFDNGIYRIFSAAFMQLYTRLILLWRHINPWV